MINNGSGCKFNPATMLIHGTSMGLWHPAMDINRITVGISGIAGMQMIEISGHLGLLVAMMMGGRRSHSGIVNRRSTSTRARVQSGTETILMLLWRALAGDAKLLISHFRERNQTLLHFSNVARAAYLKHDAYGYPLPDRTKGMIFLRQAKIPGHLEDHIMAKTNGSRNFSDLLDAIQILARRPMSQISSSFPSYYDEWDDSTNATEYYDIDDHDDVDNDEYYDEYNEPEDHDNEWIDMSGIPEEATFEESELACMLRSLQKGKKGSGKGFRKGKKLFSMFVRMM